MCEVCRQTPCHPRCPNAPEPTPVYECSECGYGIYDGDKYAEIDGKYYCEECLDDMAAETLLALMGYEMEAAETAEEDWYDEC